VVRNRVQGTIAIARALGDKSLAAVLGQRPDVFEVPLASADLLILACDGIWDVLSDEEVRAIARFTGCC
jgi:serine/threonine protein phosphatase PrpC